MEDNLDFTAQFPSKRSEQKNIFFNIWRKNNDLVVWNAYDSILGDDIKVIQGIFSDGFRLFTDFAWLLRIALSI